MAAEVFISKHPLLLCRLAELRDKTTPPQRFRRLVGDLSQYLFHEVAQHLTIKEKPVETPLTTCVGHQLGERIGLVPVLRAGLGMAEAILDQIPEAQVWHLGLYRDHETCQPVTYYNKLPKEPTVEFAAVLDPMLATGGSAIACLDILKAWGVKKVWFIGLIAAPEGVRRMQEKHPDVPIALAALDSHLNEKNYIVPGLGDAGDRQFATT